MKKEFTFPKIKFWFASNLSLVVIAAAEIRAQAQMPPVSRGSQPPTEDFTWWYISLFVLAVGLAGAVIWWLNSRKSAVSPIKPNSDKQKDEWGRNSLDADKELEWLRKNQKIMGKKPSINGKKNLPDSLPQSAKTNGSGAAKNGSAADGSDEYMPIFTINSLSHAKPFDMLPISSDEALMSAIEQTHDEMEEDEEVRDLALRILAAFRTRNSVESLSEIALYDLSSNLRSRAVSILSEFDHESVFETILLACSEPTREVRAAAARGLTKLTFNRADAWMRIIETEEEGRIIQTARAAIESGFVEMSFDRLIHQDRHYAYEAMTLMALLIKAGETEKIFNQIENHRNMNVRKALLHVIKVTKDKKALGGLYAMLEKNNLPLGMQEEIDKTIEEIGFVTV